MPFVRQNVMQRLARTLFTKLAILVVRPYILWSDDHDCGLKTKCKNKRVVQRIYLPCYAVRLSVCNRCVRGVLGTWTHMVKECGEALEGHIVVFHLLDAPFVTVTQAATRWLPTGILFPKT